MQKLTNLFYKVNEDGSLTFKTKGIFDTQDEANKGEGPGVGWSYITTTSSENGMNNHDLVLGVKEKGTPQDLITKTFQTVKEAGKGHTLVVLYNAPEKEAGKSETIVGIMGDLPGVATLFSMAGQSSQPVAMAISLAAQRTTRRSEGGRDLESLLMEFLMK